MKALSKTILYAFGERPKMILLSSKLYQYEYTGVILSNKDGVRSQHYSRISYGRRITYRAEKSTD